MPERLRTKLLSLLLVLGALAALVPATASAAETPDPLERGSYEVERLDPFKAGLATLQEPNSGGSAPGTGSNSSITLQIRGSAFVPVDKSGKSPLIVLVHGNHTQCDLGTSPECEVFKRNDEGYAYLAENLATWGYSVFSLDQDQLMARQDGSFGKGMHARRLLIMALLDALYKANEEPLAEGENYNLPASLVGTLDFERIGLMGHSRGGDAVSSFIEYDRMRPTGRRYPLRGVISLAPVDYERHAPYGMPYMTIYGTCDGDVSNLQGARLFERSQYVQDDPYPRIQSAQMGANHNWYNTVWFADGEDSNTNDDACTTSKANNLRLSGQAGTGASENYVTGNTNTLEGAPDKLNPEVNTRISGDPARMGDQEKIGLATMAAFFRRYVGGEGAFEPYLTGQRSSEGEPEIPLSACPTSESGTRISCLDRVSTTYQAPPEERLDLIRPDTEHPLTMSALGTRLTATGFSNPYLDEGGVSPKPETTAGGIDWCNPDPWQAETVRLTGSTYNPPAEKACPLPAASALGGQTGIRERAPVNQSYGRQLAIAWEGPASLSTKIPAVDGDVSGYKALTMSAAVNFFDSRNPERSSYDPEIGRQHFTIAIADGEGNEATVDAGDAGYGTALEQSVGSTSTKVHVILRGIRVPLDDFAEQGVDLSDVTKLEFRFADEGEPQSGSIQLADVRFQEAVGGSDVLVDSTEPDAGPGEGPPSSGPDPKAELEEFDRAPASMQLPDVTTEPGANVWTVDDDKKQCPNAEFTKIQDAIDQAAPWETVVVCAGVYEESTTPYSTSASPSQSGSTNGLTIDKPLKIKGAGASLVKIRPAAEEDGSLAGTTPYLRDGGGNVVTISRQSLGSTDYIENFTEISGVTIESPSTYAEAGVAFFNTSGRISDSVIGPLKRSSTKSELAEKPYGWGVVATNSLLGEGEGTIRRAVTVDHTLVHGYQTGGILFDDASGADGDVANTTGSAIIAEGYVNDSVVEGSGLSNVIPQAGIRYHAGTDGAIADSTITDNLYVAAQRKSVGVLLTGAGSDWSIKGSTITGNGYGVYNADVTNAAVQDGAPADATENWWGPLGPAEGPSLLNYGIEGYSEADSEGNPSVEVEPLLDPAPTAPAIPGTVPDSAPTGEIVDPGDGLEVGVGEEIEPVVLAEDDFGVKSVELTAGGSPVATVTESPYTFVWAPSQADAEKTVALKAVITDSAGQTTTSSVDVEVGGKATPPAEETTTPAEEPTTTPGEEETTAGGKTPGFRVKLQKLKRVPGAGTAFLRVQVPSKGYLVANGKGVRKVVRRPRAPRHLWIPVRAQGGKLKALKKKGHVKVKVRLKFVAAGHKPVTSTRTVVLVKK